MVVLFMAFLIFVDLVHDAGRVLNANAHASDAAAKAARFGAQEITIASIRSGTYLLDPASAQQTARAYLNRHRLNGRVQATAQTVTVTVIWPVEFRFLPYRSGATVTQTRTATPTSG